MMALTFAAPVGAFGRTVVVVGRFPIDPKQEDSSFAESRLKPYLVKLASDHRNHLRLDIMTGPVKSNDLRGHWKSSKADLAYIWGRIDRKSQNYIANAQVFIGANGMKVPPELRTEQFSNVKGTVKGSSANLYVAAAVVVYAAMLQTADDEPTKVRGVADILLSLIKAAEGTNMGTGTKCLTQLRTVANAVRRNGSTVLQKGGTAPPASLADLSCEPGELQ